MGVNRSYWSGRRVLVTGHTGFKGGWLAAWLKRLGARVTGYALAPAQRPNLFELANIGDDIESSIGDLGDLVRLSAVVAAAEPEIVFHLAAQPLVRLSYEQPVETFATNVLGTVNLLQAARAVRSIRAIVVVTTDKVYENRDWVWPYREKDRLGGHDPYAASKACAELVTSSYRDSFFTAGNVGVATVRAGNVIGGGDWSRDRLVPDVIMACQERNSVRLRNPTAVRPWQHVLEPLHGYLMLAERLAEEPAVFGSEWNFGPDENDALTVGEVTRRLIALWGSGSAEIDSDAHPHETHALRLDSSKARTLLGWRPLLDVDEALRWTVEWYRKPGSLDMQIERFEERLHATMPVLS
jgi:CDP-glucose 4,6-dehydratase